jgi:hypothetical protein
MVMVVTEYSFDKRLILLHSRVNEQKPGEPGFLDTGYAVTYSAGRMFAACLPFGPVTMSKVTFWFSARVLKPLP